MATSGTPVEVNLLTSLNVDTVDEDVWVFGDPQAGANQNTGIEREGGITNIHESETLFSEAGDYLMTENSLQLAAVPSGTQRIVKVNGGPVGQVSAYGVQSRADILGVDDVALTADSSYLTIKISGTSIVLSEYSLAGVFLRTRTVTFPNLTNYIQFYTSISFVRYDLMHFLDSQEFALRLGDQVVILQESNTSVSVPVSLASSTVLGIGNAIYCSLVYGNTLIVAGANGRVGSFDGAAWRNYDGSGTGIGTYNAGTVTGNGDINCMALFGNGFAVAGAGGKLGSWDGLNWKNYDGTGGGTGVANNATLIGANAINAMAVWKNYLVVGGVGGRIGSTDGTNYFLYTQTPTVQPTSNALAIGANDIKAMAKFISTGGLETLCVAGVGGRLANWEFGGWIYSSGSLAPSAPAAAWTVRTAPAATGGGWMSIVYGNGLFVAINLTTSTSQAIMTSPDGVTWTLRNTPAPAAVWQKLYFGNGIFLALAPGTTSTTQAIMTSSDGITWTLRTTPVSPSSVGWFSACYGAGLWVVVDGNTANSVITSPDGITWTQRTCPARTVSLVVAYGAGVFVALSGGVGSNAMTSPDGITWTATTLTPSNVKTVIFGGGQFVLANGAIMTSPDGITWTGRTSPVTPGNGWYGVVYGGGQYVAVANASAATNAVETSPDGVTWTSRTNVATSGFLTSVAYGARVWVAVEGAAAANGVILAQDSNTTGIFNNQTAVSTDDILSLYTDTNLIILGGSLGKVGSFNGTVWANYNAGSGLTNNAAVIGAVAINAITKFGTTYVFGGASGRLGSWDGTAWKNYDGTGTGVGVFNNQTVVGTAIIRGLAVLSGLLHVQSAGGLDNTMTSLGGTVPLYNNGGTFVANLLTGMTNLGGLYVFRYQSNGLYLINLTGNNLNTAYILNNTTRDISVLKAMYAFPQTSGGFTRHILTETPRTNGSEVFAVSQVGFVSFTLASFVQVQVYPTTGLAASGINSAGTSKPFIGFNYADFCFKLTASATNVYNWLSPVPAQAPAANLYKVYQGNTDTNINGYGKLNNVFGLPSSLPFEFRVVWTAGEQATLSVAVLDGLATDCLGTLLTNLGEFDPSYTPHLVGDDTLLYQNGGVFKVLRVGMTMANIVQKISPRLYKINTISPLNIFDAQTSQLCLGSIDYHGQMLFNSIAIPQAAGIPVASVILDKYCNSIDTGDKLAFIPSLAAANLQIFGNRLPAQATIPPAFSVDTFISDVYSFSTLSSGLQSVLYSKVSTLYLPTTTLPVAIGGVYAPQTVGYPNTTVILSENFEGYEPSNELFGTYLAFQLFGQLYLFDGEWIYQATFQGGLLGTLVRLAAADGLVFIAVAPTRAHFLSNSDNSLFEFDGGRSLSKSKRLTMMEPILNGVHNVFDNTLLLQTANTLIWIRDDVATMNLKKSSQMATPLRLYDTTSGVVIGNNTGQWKYTYVAAPGSTTVPLSWSSAYFGMDRNQKSIVKSFVLTIRASAGVSGFLTLDSFDQDQKYTQREPFTISKRDINALGYARLRIQPKYQRSLGMQFTITTPSDVLLQNLVVLFEEDVNAPAQPRLSL